MVPAMLPEPGAKVPSTEADLARVEGRTYETAPELNARTASGVRSAVPRSPRTGRGARR